MDDEIVERERASIRSQQLHRQYQSSRWVGPPSFTASWACQGTVCHGGHSFGVWWRIRDNVVERQAFRWNGRKWKPYQ